MCFSALWKLDVRDNNTKTTKNITAIGKVTLHVWASNWGQRPAEDAEALNKRTEGKRAYPSQSPVLGSGGITPGKFVKIQVQICAIWCILELKISIFVAVGIFQFDSSG